MRISSFHALASCCVALMLQGGVADAWPSPAPWRVTSASFTDGGRMPSKFTCDGANLSPDLRLSAPPSGTRSIAIVVDDLDAPAPFTHWLAYGLAAGTRELPEGAATAARRLEHAAEGINSFGRIGYGGPCPPPGTPHRYVFHAYALDTVPALPSGASPQQLDAALRGHVLAEGRITGVYARGGD